MSALPAAWTPPAIARSASHEYTFQGVTYPGVTGILKVLDKSDALMNWAARQTAEAAMKLAPHPAGAVDSPLEYLIATVGTEGAIKAVTSRSSWQRDEAANIGTEIHGYADMIVNGLELPPLSPTIVERVNHYAEWWKASGWTLRIAEAMVVNPVAGDGGTFDLLARDPEGRTVLADVKTGKGVYREAILQLAAYGMATWVAPSGGATAYPMPEIHRYVVLHVTASGVREVEVNVGNAERIAFLSCCDLAGWIKTVKGRL